MKGTKMKEFFKKITDFPVSVKTTRRKFKTIIQESQKLHTLLQINEEILSERPLPELLHNIVKSGVNFLQADAGTLRLADKDKNSLTLKATSGTYRPLSTEILPINEESIAGKVFLEKKPIQCLNISREPSYPWNGEETSNFTSLLTVPLKTKDKILGVFSVYTREKREFSELEVKTAQMFASLSTLAIINRVRLEQIYQSAITEKLTGLYNQNYFYERLKEEVARSSRNNYSLSLIFIDVDWLKSINDSYGHLVGDEALKKISQVIRSCVRKVDLPFRYGGDELAALLPQTDGEAAYQIAERIRSKVSKISFREKFHLTVSIGVATYPQDANNPQDLLSKADSALYKAKQKGRNHVERFNA